MARTNVVVPQLGNEITEAEVDEWLKKPGERVGAKEPLVVLTTPKVTMEIEAPAAGVVSEVLVEEADIVEVGAVLAVIEADG